MPWEITESIEGFAGDKSVVVCPDSVLRFRPGGVMVLQATVDPLDGVAFVLGNDALLDV